MAILNKQKCHFFSFTKWRTGGQNRSCQWEGGGSGKKGMGGWIWYKYCVHMYVNGKMIPVETIPGMGKGDKGE
jgi:hypothetical protein